jgi:hypothetical protein
MILALIWVLSAVMALANVVVFSALVAERHDSS